MSMPMEMHDAMETVYRAVRAYTEHLRAQTGTDFAPGQLFVDQPKRKDYRASMSLPVFEIMDDATHCRRIGYVKITGTGTVSMPNALRQALAPHL